MDNLMGKHYYAEFFAPGTNDFTQTALESQEMKPKPGFSSTIWNAAY